MRACSATFGWGEDGLSHNYDDSPMNVIYPTLTPEVMNGTASYNGEYLLLTSHMMTIEHYRHWKVKATDVCFIRECALTTTQTW